MPSLITTLAYKKLLSLLCIKRAGRESFSLLLHVSNIKKAWLLLQPLLMLLRTSLRGYLFYF